MHTGVLALLGSGETAPGMTKVHRALLARHPEGTAINLDTSYGFQENVPQMTEKIAGYFEVSLHRTLDTVTFTNYETASPLERTIAKQRVREADYVFAGPGSPSYALKQWRPLDLVDDFISVLEHDGVLCFSSAATLTLGAFTAPIYEIYKVGDAPHWLKGLDLTARLGLNCVVIPHFDNHEGSNYDTRYCYLGERRLELLESQLPENVATLGIDEHTALLFDLGAGEARVIGRGNAYWRHHGTVITLTSQAPTPLSALRSQPVAPRTRVLPTNDDSRSNNLTLAELVTRGGPAGTEALARLVRLADGATTSTVDVTALIEEVVRIRDSARGSKQFDTADRLRDALIVAGVAIADEPTGTRWSITNS